MTQLTAREKFNNSGCDGYCERCDWCLMCAVLVDSPRSPGLWAESVLRDDNDTST